MILGALECVILGALECVILGVLYLVRRVSVLGFLVGFGDALLFVESF